MGMDSFDTKAVDPQPRPIGDGKEVTQLTIGVLMATYHSNQIANVVSDLTIRREHGIKKYGTSLKTHNGRNPIIDAYQESIDQMLYLKQALEEGFIGADVGSDGIQYMSLTEAFSRSMDLVVYLRKVIDSLTK